MVGWSEGNTEWQNLIENQDLIAGQDLQDLIAGQDLQDLIAGQDLTEWVYPDV
jgi:hypothetical protein